MSGCLLKGGAALSLQLGRRIDGGAEHAQVCRKLVLHSPIKRRLVFGDGARIHQQFSSFAPTHKTL